MSFAGFGIQKRVVAKIAGTPALKIGWYHHAD